MADLSAVSPLLDHMIIGPCISSKNGISCYEIRHDASGQKFILKHISLPESEEKVQALILSGAYADASEANAYYQRIANSYAEEFQIGKALADCPNVVKYLAYQVVPRESGIGFDVYAIMSWEVSLKAFMADNALSNLRAVNLGIDLCVALSAIREAGYVHQNIKPENIFLAANGSFMLGDLGLASIQDMNYSSLPEQYFGPYTAPELYNIMSGLNTTIDIYAVGVLLYRIYNGNHAPFEDEKTTAKTADHMRVSGEPLPAPIFADYELAEIILKACAFKPEDRYQMPEELKHELELYMQRNAISDSLIVPPIISDPEPLIESIAEEEGTAPVRFTDLNQLDETFKAHFAPDTATASAAAEKAQAEAQKAAEKEQKAAEAELQASAGELDTEALLAASNSLLEEPASKAEEETPLTMVEMTGEDVQREAAGEGQKPVEKKAETKKKTKKKGKAGWIVLAAVLLLAAVGAVLFFFTGLGSWLTSTPVEITKMELTSATADSISVELTSEAEQLLVSLHCQDAYGNTFVGRLEGNVATFEGLTSGTQYTITVQPGEKVRLSGVTSMTASTMPSTEILTLTAIDGTEEGAVALSLVVKDGNSEPESWTVSYCYEGGTPQTQTFTGHSTQINGLEVGKEYTFELVDSEPYYIVGKTSTTFTPVREVTAEAFAMDSFVDGILTLSWNCTSETPELWTVYCTDDQGNTATVETAECTVSLKGLTLGEHYVVKLTAAGLFRSLELDIPDNLIYMDSLSVALEADGLHLSWECAETPEGGWLLQYTTGGDGAYSPVVAAETNSVVLTSLIPGTSYSFQVKAADGRTVVGHNTAAYETAAAESFESRGIRPDNTTLTLYKCPTEAGWTKSELGEPVTDFTATDKIAFLITSGTGRYKGSFSVMYVVRNEAGEPVDCYEGQYVWNEVWQKDGSQYAYVGSFARMPGQAGVYTLEVYFSYDMEGFITYSLVAASQAFTVTAE